MLISCLPDTNKGMDKDFLIVSSECHEGLHCLTQDGTLDGMFRFRFRFRFITQTFFFVLICKLVLIYLPVFYSYNVLLLMNF